MDATGDDEMEFGEIEVRDLGGKTSAIVLAEAGFDNFLAVAMETDLGLLLAQLAGPLDQIEGVEDTFYAILESLVYAGAEPVDLSSAAPITTENVSGASVVMTPQLASEDEWAETFDSLISSDGNFVAATGYDEVDDFVQIWDLSTGESVALVYEDAWTMAIDPDGNIIGTNSTDTLTVISPEGEVLDGITLSGLGENVNEFRFNDDGNLLLASGNNDSETTDYTLYDLSTGEAISEFTSDYSRAAAISNDGSMVALIAPPYSDMQTLTVVDTATGEILYTIEESNYISDAAFSSDNSHIFYNHDSNGILYIAMYDLENDEIVYGYDAMMLESIGYLTFMADDSIVVGVAYNVVVFFDAETGRRLRSIETGIDGRANAISISEDERFIVTSAYGQTVVIAVGGE